MRVSGIKHTPLFLRHIEALDCGWELYQKFFLVLQSIDRHLINQGSFVLQGRHLLVVEQMISFDIYHETRIGLCGQLGDSTLRSL